MRSSAAFAAVPGLSVVVPGGEMRSLTRDGSAATLSAIVAYAAPN